MNSLRYPSLTRSWRYHRRDRQSTLRWPIPSWKTQYSPDLGPFGFCGSGRLGRLDTQVWSLMVLNISSTGILNGRSGSAVSSLFDSYACRDGLWIATKLWFGFFLGENCCFSFSPLEPCLEGAIGCTPSRLFDLHVLFRLDKNVPHLGNIVLH